jgi:hypothetical protein
MVEPRKHLLATSAVPRSAAVHDNLAEQKKRLLAGYYAEEEAASELRQTARTLRLWRQRGIGPAWTRVGRRIFYSEAALLAWIKSLEQQSVRLPGQRASIPQPPSSFGTQARPAMHCARR